jgi:hypothetical protein
MGSAIVKFGCGCLAVDPLNLEKPGLSDCPACFEAFGVAIMPPPDHLTIRESSTGRRIVFRIPRRVRRAA